MYHGEEQLWCEQLLPNEEISLCWAAQLQAQLLRARTKDRWDSHLDSGSYQDLGNFNHVAFGPIP